MCLFTDSEIEGEVPKNTAPLKLCTHFFIIIQ